MNIAIDIDGVISDSESEYARIAADYGLDDSFLNEYNGMWKTFTSDGRKLGLILMQDHREEWIENAEPYEDTIEAFGRFSSNPRMDISFVTARNEDVRSYTQNWLDKYGLEAPLFFESNKLKADSQVLIDDHPRHVQDYLDNGRMGILMTRQYNRDIDAPYRVDTLTEAYELLNRLI